MAPGIFNSWDAGAVRCCLTTQTPKPTRQNAEHTQGRRNRPAAESLRGEFNQGAGDAEQLSSGDGHMRASSCKPILCLNNEQLLER